MSEPEVLEVNEHDIATHGESTAVAVRVSKELATPSLSVDELLDRQHKVLDLMTRAMKDGVHYGKIPGIDKPALLKPGAEMLCNLFQLSPNFPDERQSFVTDPVSGHLDVRSLCVLKHIPSSFIVSEAHGSCSTREKKYAYRGGSLVCPKCGNDSVKKGKTRDKSADQFYCWRKNGGCGATWDVGTEQFDAFEQERKAGIDRVANPDLPDQYNTVLKMSEKRALIAATLMATGASDVFTQDVEDQAGPAGDSSTREPVSTDPSPVPVGYLNWGPKVLADKFAEAGVESEWLAQVVEAEYGTGKAFAELDREQKNLVGQKLRTAFARLYEMLGPEGKLSFPGPKRGEIRLVFATVLDGLMLEGPPWRMHPPEYDPDEAAYEPQNTGVEEELQEGEKAAKAAAEDLPLTSEVVPDDDIPF